MNESDDLANAGLNLLIYVPRQRGTIEDEKRQDPFEVFAWAGVAFGDKEAEQLESLARQAIPERAIEITRLFAQGSPTLSMLDKLQFHHRSPLLLEALGTDSPSEAIALVLCLDEKSQRIDSVKGCLKEFLQLLATEIGFKPLLKAKSWTEIRKQLGQYLLFNEFALDLPYELPQSFSGLPRAEASHELVIFAVCDRMRDSSDLRSGYVQLAVEVENQLHLGNLTENIAQLGTRDTFPFAEKRYLQQVLEYVQQNNLADAQKILTQRRHSIWNNHLERGNIWMIVERCVTFLATSNAVEELKIKRRSLLGQFISGESSSVVIFKTEQVGIQGDAQDLCVAKGFKVFQQVEGYFHEGISLQEAIVPLVILRSQGKITAQSKPNIFLRYKYDYFTNKVINLRVCYEYLLLKAIQVRIEAYDGSTAKAKRVGKATDCDARDERTGEIILQPNQETSVPILLESDDISCSKIEMRAIDPQTGVIWAKLELENRLLD